MVQKRSIIGKKGEKKYDYHDILNLENQETQLHREILLWCTDRFLESFKAKNPEMFEKANTAQAISNQIAAKLSHHVLSYQDFRNKCDEILHERENFRFAELGNYLIRNHRPFVEEFKGSPLSISLRLHSKRNYIQSRLEDLKKLFSMAVQKKAKAKKNSSETPLYIFTITGIVASWSLRLLSKKEDDPSLVTIELVLYQMWAGMLSLRFNSFKAFLLEFIGKIWVKNVLYKFVKECGADLLNFFVKRQGKELRERILFLISTSNQFREIFKTTLMMMEDEDRRLLLSQFKFDLETTNYDQIAPVDMEWEQMRYANLYNYQNIVLYGTCLDCGIVYPFLMSFYEFIELPNLFATFPDLSDQGSVEYKAVMINCSKCGGRDSFQVYASWRKQGLHPFIVTDSEKQDT